jgi:hypothetical protein
MTTDPDQIRADITSLLAVLPDPDSVDADVEVIAERLEEAHDRLVQALESVETGRSAATREGVSSAATGGVATPGTGW